MEIAVKPAACAKFERAGTHRDRVLLCQATFDDVDLPAPGLPFLEPDRPRFGRKIAKTAHNRFNVRIDRFGSQRLELVQNHISIDDRITEPQSGFDRWIIGTQACRLAPIRLQSLRFEYDLSHVVIAHDRIIEHK